MQEIIRKTTELQTEYLPLYQAKFENITTEQASALKKNFLHKLFTVLKTKMKK